MPVDPTDKRDLSAKQMKADWDRSVAAEKESKAAPRPEGYHSITPYLQVNGAAQLIEVLKCAFGAEEVAYRSARRAGANLKYAPRDESYGDRAAGVTDPFGNVWVPRRVSACRDAGHAKGAASARPSERGPALNPLKHSEDAAAAIDFYKNSFGVTEMVRLERSDGLVAHCEIRVGDATILLADEWAAVGASSPSSLGGSGVIVHLLSNDVDAIAKRALKVGAEAIFPVKDQLYGERAGRLRYPFGHVWLPATKIEGLSTAQLRKRENDYFHGEFQQIDEGHYQSRCDSASQRSFCNGI